MFWCRRLGAVLVVVAVLVAAGPASARPLPAGAVRVQTPSSGSVVLGRSVRVVVGPGSAVTSFRASLNGRGVTGAFSLAGSHRVATLRYGRSGGLRLGHNALSVRGRNRDGHERGVHVSFVLARRASGLLDGVASRDVCGAGASLNVVLARRGLRVRVAVNGHRRVLGGSGTRRTLALDADDGLRPGQNVIVVRAVDADRGLYSERQVRLLMPKDLPVAGAGPARRGKVGEVIHFTAASSVAPAGVRLRYHWVLVGRPRGSKARLQDANTAHPFVRPDRPGRYIAQVTVTPAGGPPEYTGARGRKAPPCAARGSSSTTTLDAAITVPAIGVGIDTIARRDGKLGVSVDPTNATGNGSFSAVLDPSRALQLVVLNRYTLAVALNISYPDDLPGVTLLKNTVERLTKGPSAPLVVISRPDPTVNNFTTGDGTQVTSTLGQALADVGVSANDWGAYTHLFDRNPCSPQGDEECGSFSAIGLAGGASGDATFNPGLAGLPGSGQLAGDVHGSMVQSTNEVAKAYPLVFVDHERVPFDTGDPDANPAVVTVGSDAPGSPFRETTHTSATLAPGQAGFYVVAFDTGSLKERLTGTFTTGTPAPNSGVGTLQDMADLLDLCDKDPSTLVVVRSIGKVGRVGNPAWDEVATDLQQLGGSRYYFDALNGDTGDQDANEPVNGDQYAQVGPGNPTGGTYPDPSTQVATEARSGSERLTGLLARNSLSQWYPDESAPIPTDPKTKGPVTDESTIVNRALDGTLAGLVSLPSSPWPDRGGDDANVLQCIAHQENIGYPIEADYAGDYSIKWGILEGHLDNDGYYDKLKARSDCKPFTGDDFKTVRDQLDLEWTDVPTVRTLIDELKSVYLNPKLAADKDSIVSSISQSINPPQDGTATIDPVGLAANLGGLLAALPGPQQPVVGLLAAALSLGSALNVDPRTGDPAGDVSVGGANLGTTLAGRFSDAMGALDRYYDVLVSDWPKLQVAALNANGGVGPAATANWTWNDYTSVPAVNAVQRSAKQFAYETLMPLAYRPYRLAPGSSTADSQDPNSYLCSDNPQNGATIEYKPFQDASSLGTEPVVVDGTGRQYAWVLGGLDTGWLKDLYHDNAGPPSDALLQQMLNTPQADGDNLFGSMLQFDLESYPGASPGNGVTHYYIGYPIYSSNWCKTFDGSVAP